MLITDSDSTPNDPNHLPDAALIEKVTALAAHSREITAELIAHLVELERRNLHLACGFSSLYWYCRDVLRFSEPESYQRMQAVHIAGRFPVILPLLADGRLHLAGVRLLAPHLEDEDHLALIGGALGQSKRNIEKLLARWFPRPAVPASIRKAPRRRAAAPSVGPTVSGEEKRAQIAPLSATDYLVKFTANEQMIGRLRQAQELLSHAIPDGDIVAILDRALMLVIEHEQRRRHAATASARRPAAARKRRPATRTVYAEVQREVWARDDGQCAYVAADGRRCQERRFLEYHHLKPWIVGGPPSVVNIALRCRAHNQYEAKVYFDPIRKARASDA